MLLQTFNRQMILRIHYLFVLFQVFNDTENSLFICVIPSFQWYWEFIIYLCYSKFSWILWIVSNYKIKNLMNIVHHIYVRDRPFNLQGGLWFFVSFRIFFSHNTRVRIFIFLSCKARNFFPEFNKRLYDKNSESDYFFFPPPKSEYFFQQHWESEYLKKKKNITPPPPPSS